MIQSHFDNVVFRIRGRRLALSAVASPFRTAYWREADGLKSQLDLGGLPLETLGASAAAQERFLERFAARATEGEAFKPGRIGFSAAAEELRRREAFRSHYRLVKFLGKCSRAVVLGTLEAVGRQLAARGRIEAHLRDWAVSGAGFDGLEAVRDICGFLREMDCCGAPLVLFSDLRELDAGLWQFVYEHPVVRIAWVASEFLACSGPNEFEDLCSSSAPLKNLREISDRGLWPQVVLPVSAANVRVLPELAAGLLELTRGAEIEILPVSFLPALKERAAPPGAGEYAEVLLKIYATAGTPLRLLSPLSWVSGRMDSETAMIGSAASAGAELAVLPDGNMYPGEFGAGLERWCLGNVLKEAESLRWERLDVVPESSLCSGQPERCRACDWRYRCGGLDASVLMLEEQCQAASGRARARELARRGDEAAGYRVSAESGHVPEKPTTEGAVAAESQAAGWPGLLADLYCAPRKRLFEEMLWGSAEAAARGQAGGPRERLELSHEGIGYVPVESGT